ncbi:MAG: hypothetical protein SGJ03_18055, partial [Alphaproteobacteria bacterium]|nr:hypothetical protein [Alphaproteobacteria bacterium]
RIHHRPPIATQWMTTDSALQSFVTTILHPIALGKALGFGDKIVIKGYSRAHIWASMVGTYMSSFNA